MCKAEASDFYRGRWTSLGASGQPNPELVFHETLADGAMYSCRFTMTGVQRGEFMGFPASNRPFVLQGITVMRFANGRVEERWSCAELGGGVIVLPGVTIGDDCVIGAGAVVSRDIPAKVVAVGNPARVIRSI